MRDSGPRRSGWEAFRTICSSSRVMSFLACVIGRTQACRQACDWSSPESCDSPDRDSPGRDRSRPLRPCSARELRDRGARPGPARGPPAHRGPQITRIRRQPVTVMPANFGRAIPCSGRCRSHGQSPSARDRAHRPPAEGVVTPSDMTTSGAAPSLSGQQRPAVSFGTEVDGCPSTGRVYKRKK